ncbi:hypothetical protein F4821DRAFT_264813 [Hypoxylon rubiginosum]|uniref:Uncharacterized protein n=1 Tax=Hypoxylon rubiginosum TaxID=110542 RepID=A0ACC0CMD3_9PEZI|nr:hypothetical protein F4821DRAFT_264813 [Hypoxylon rubiginosum]
MLERMENPQPAQCTPSSTLAGSALDRFLLPLILGRRNSTDPKTLTSAQWLEGRREQDRTSVVGWVALVRRQEQDRHEALSRCSVDGEDQVHPSIVEGAQRRGAKARPRLSIVGARVAARTRPQRALSKLELCRERDHSEHCRTSIVGCPAAQRESRLRLGVVQGCSSYGENKSIASVVGGARVAPRTGHNEHCRSSSCGENETATSNCRKLVLWRDQDHTASVVERWKDGENTRPFPSGCRWDARGTARTRLSRDIVDGGCPQAGEDKTGVGAIECSKGQPRTGLHRDIVGRGAHRRGEDRTADETFTKICYARWPAWKFTVTAPGNLLIIDLSEDSEIKPFAEPESLSQGSYAQEISSDTTSRLPVGFLETSSPPVSRGFLGDLGAWPFTFTRGDLPANPSQTSGQLPLRAVPFTHRSWVEIGRDEEATTSYFRQLVGGQTFRRTNGGRPTQSCLPRGFLGIGLSYKRFPPPNAARVRILSPLRVGTPLPLRHRASEDPITLASGDPLTLAGRELVTERICKHRPAQC